MKFRPQIQLRFRSEAQMQAVKAKAAAVPLSVNEWILSQLETAHPALSEAVVVASTNKVRPKKAATAKAQSSSCGECGSLGGFHQKGCKSAKG